MKLSTGNVSDLALNSTGAIQLYDPLRLERAALQRKPVSRSPLFHSRVKTTTVVEDMRPSKLANIGYHCPVETKISSVSLKR